MIPELEYVLKEAGKDRTPPGEDRHAGEGTKCDWGKPKLRQGLLEQFPLACIAVAVLSEYGAGKYSWNDWKEMDEVEERYGEGELRHAVLQYIQGEKDKDSPFLHDTCEAWCALARLERHLENIKKELENGK